MGLYGSYMINVFVLQNHLINSLYPAPPMSLFLMVAVVMGLQLYSGKDWSYVAIEFVAIFFPEWVSIGRLYVCIPTQG